MVGPGPIEEPADGIVERVADALKADSRVVQVDAPPQEDSWCTSEVLYPSPIPTEEGVGVDTWNYHLHSFRFGAPMRFTVAVPPKNQPRMTEGDELPTSYEVWWDGVVILTSWRLPASEPIGLSGGHVIEEILSDALEREGFGLYVQGCSANCTAGYAHTTLRLLPSEGKHDEVQYVESMFVNEVTALVPGPLAAMPETLYLDLRIPAGQFTVVKNLGRRILDLEATARRSLDGLLSLGTDRTELPLLSRRDRARQRWRLRHWRAQSRRRVAELWRALSLIERLRRQWAGERFEFDDTTSSRGLRRLFARDHAGEVARIESLDLGLMRAAVEEAASQMDRRALVRVTGAGAIAGGVAGTIFGLLTHLV
jgi:hypothetical protein